MTVLDVVLVVVWAGITLGGFFKGAIRIVFGLGGAALGIWLAVVIGPDLAIVLADRVDNRWVASALAYLAPLAVVSLLCLVAGWGIDLLPRLGARNERDPEAGARRTGGPGGDPGGRDGQHARRHLA